MRFRSSPARLARASVAPTLVLVGFLAATTIAATGAQRDDRTFYGPDGEPLPFQGREAVLDFLRTAPVVDSRPAPGGTSGALWLTLEDERGRARAAFRHQSERRTGIRMPDGEAFAGFYDSAMAEVAAYELAELLGIRMIPPATVRRHAGEQGTIQLWIEGAMTEGARSRQGLRPPQVARWRIQQTAMEVFDALVHNSDRNSGNSLIDEQWRVWMIDHTRTFQRPRGRPGFGSVLQIPEFLWRSLRRLDAEMVAERCGRFLEPLQLRALHQRQEALVQHLEALIAQRGYEAVVLSDTPPAPGR